MAGKTGKKSYMDRQMELVQEEVASGVPMRAILKRLNLGLIPVNNGADYRRLVALARSLGFLGFVGQLYLKEPELVTQKKVKEYFDLLRTVDDSITKLAELYYSEEFQELRNQLFRKAGVAKQESDNVEVLPIEKSISKVKETEVK